MQRGCNAGRARHLRTTGSARATAPLEGTRPRAGRAPVQNGSHKKPIVWDGGLSGLPICGSVGRGPKARRTRLLQEVKRFAHVRFCRTGPEDIDNGFLPGRPRRFADFRVRRTGPEKFVCQKSYAVWQFSDRPVKFSGRLMTEPERFFGGSPMPFAHFRVRTPFGI